METRSIERPANVSTPWEQFYGLGERPFSLTPDLRFAFHSRSHSQALQQLTEALRRREGLIVVTGEIGTGKTMLCRTLLQTFEKRTFVSVILDPGLGVDDLLQHVLVDFGLVPRPAAGGAPRPGGTRHQMVTTLQRFLSTLVPLNAHAVVMVDEAQQVDPAVLEQLRLLTNFETDAAKLLQVVLVGQPNLDEVLARPDMRQLAQRVARRIALYPLSEIEVQRYVERRLLVASEAGAATALEARAESPNSGPQFTPAAFRSIAAITGGIPRVINTLCDRALEIGFERRTVAIDEAVVNQAAERLKLSPPHRTGKSPEPAQRAELEEMLPQRARLGPWWAAVAAALLLGAGATWWMAGWMWPSNPPRTTNAPPRAPQSAPQVPAATAPAPAMPANPPAPPASSSPAADPSATDSSAGHYFVVVAAFRTTQRASEVAAALAAAGLDAFTRPASGGSWQQVLVGPLQSPDEAAAAQKVLGRQGFGETRVVVEPPSGR